MTDCTDCHCFEFVGLRPCNSFCLFASFPVPLGFFGCGDGGGSLSLSVFFFLRACDKEIYTICINVAFLYYSLSDMNYERYQLEEDAGAPVYKAITEEGDIQYGPKKSEWDI